MAQAQAYNRQKNFQENAPSATDHGALNAELDRAATSINQLRTNQQALQADDGTLKAGTVTPEALTPQAVLLLKGEKGDKGDKGDQGLQGPPGPDGPKGDVGASFTPDAKDVEANLALYALAPKGFSVLAMDTGLLRFKLSAASGDWSPGFQFGKGDKGDQGEKGDKGDQGDQGLQGLKGDKGDKGDQGVAGTNGLVTAVDTTTKSVSIIGKSSVTAQLSVVAGQLTITLSAN